MLTTTDPYMIMFDSFSATVVLNALTVVLGFLPTFILVYFLYQLIVSFVLVGLTDRKFFRWGVNLVFVMLVVNVAIGGLYVRASSTGAIRTIYFSSPASTSSTPSPAVYISNIGGIQVDEMNSLPITQTSYAALGEMPFEMFAFMDDDGPEVLADSAMNLAALKEPMIQTTVSLRGSYIRLDRSSLVSGHPLRSVLSALQARSQETPGLTSFGMTTLNTLFYGANYAGAIATKAQANKLQTFIERELAEESGTNTATAVTSVYGNAYNRGIFEIASDERVRSGSLDGNDFRSAVYMVDSSSIAALSPTLDVSETDMLPDYANLAMNASVYERFCRRSNAVADTNVSTATVMNDSFTSRLNPCNVQSSAALTASIDNDAWSLPCITIAGFSLGACSNLSSLSETFNISSTAATGSCDEATTLSELQTQYATASSGLTDIDSVCMDLGEDLVSNAEQVLENAENFETLVTSYYANARQMYAYRTTSDEAFASATLGQENLADLSSALSGLFRPMADWVGSDPVTIVPNDAGSNITVQNNAQRKETRSKSRLIAAGLTFGAFAVVSSVWSAFVTFVQTVASASTAVILAYTITYYATIFAIGVGTAMFPIWLIIVAGKMFTTGQSGDSRQGINFLPMIKILGYPVLLASQLFVLQFAHAQSVTYMSKSASNTLQAVGAAALHSVDQVAKDPAYHMNYLSEFSGLIQTVGMIMIASAIPMLLAKLIQGQPFVPESRASQTANQMMNESGMSDQKIQGLTQSAGELISSLASKSKSGSGSASSSAGGSGGRSVMDVIRQLAGSGSKTGQM